MRFLNLFSPTVSNRRGFTLIEIIVVVMIIGLLAAVVAPRLIGRADEAKVTTTQNQIRNLETALKLFKLDNGFYPETEQGLDALVSQPTVGREAKHYREGGYLDSIPNDAWGNPYIYVSPGVEGDYDVISLGGDGQEGGEGFDADITNWNISR